MSNHQTGLRRTSLRQTGLLWLASLAGIAILIALTWSAIRDSELPVQARVTSLQMSSDTAGFARVEGPVPLTFPRDHGPHPDYQTEWWYYTGNLQDASGQRFGYQLTFFRRAIRPVADRQARESDLAVEQVYFAHFTITDVARRSFRAFERFERGAAGLAGAIAADNRSSGSPSGGPLFEVWLHDWSVEQVAEDTYRLHAASDDITLDLELVDVKGIVLQGDHGYSQKGPEAGNASLYYSQTRLQSRGALATGDQTFQVSGWSWLDREISTSALSKGQVGWDWFSLQLDDGSELMFYNIRNADGSPGPFSKGAYIREDGTTVPLEREDVSIRSEKTWRSPHSGGVYPSGWRIDIPSLDLSLEVTPLLTDQELNLSVIYWEGASIISGTHAGSPVEGHGYVELTGYAQSLEDTL